jgi:WD40 repeat protein
LWDTKTGKELRVLAGHQAEITTIAVGPDSKSLVSGDAANTVRVWDASSRRERFQLAFPISQAQTTSVGVRAVAFVPAWKEIAVGSRDGTVHLIDVVTGKENRSIRCHHALASMAVSPDGKLLITAGTNEVFINASGVLTMWDLATTKKIRTIAAQPRKEGQGNDQIQDPTVLREVRFSADGKVFATSESLYDMFHGSEHSPQFRIWDTATGSESRVFPTQDWASMTIFTPDGKALVAGNIDARLLLWDVASGKAIGQLVGHRGGVNGLAFSADGKILASGSEDGTILLWDTKWPALAPVPNTGR